MADERPDLTTEIIVHEIEYEPEHENEADERPEDEREGTEGDGGQNVTGQDIEDFFAKRASGGIPDEAGDTEDQDEDLAALQEEEKRRKLITQGLWGLTGLTAAATVAVGIFGTGGLGAIPLVMAGTVTAVAGASAGGYTEKWLKNRTEFTKSSGDFAFNMASLTFGILGCAAAISLFPPLVFGAPSIFAGVATGWGLLAAGSFCGGWTVGAAEHMRENDGLLALFKFPKQLAQQVAKAVRQRDDTTNAHEKTEASTNQSPSSTPKGRSGRPATTALATLALTPLALANTPPTPHTPDRDGAAATRQIIDHPDQAQDKAALMVVLRLLKVNPGELSSDRVTMHEEKDKVTIHDPISGVKIECVRDADGYSSFTRQYSADQRAATSSSEGFHEAVINPDSKSPTIVQREVIVTPNGFIRNVYKRTAGSEHGVHVSQRCFDDQGRTQERKLTKAGTAIDLDSTEGHKNHSEAAATLLGRLRSKQRA